MPSVSGSAWTPWVRPIITVSRWRSACSIERPDQRLDVGVDDRRRRRGAASPAPCRRRRTRSGRGGSTARRRRPSPAPRRRTPRCRAPARPRARRCARHRSSPPGGCESASTGIRPISAHPSHASNSTSSQRCSRDASLKIFAICCGAYRGITYVHSIGVTVGILPAPGDRAPRRFTRSPGEHPGRVRGRDRARRRRGGARRAADGRRRARGASQRVAPRGPRLDADLPGAGPAEPARAAALRHGPRSLRRPDRAGRRGQGARATRPRSSRRRRDVSLATGCCTRPSRSR